MNDWLQVFARRLEIDSGLAEGALGLTDEHQEALLDLARIVAHGTERKNAPLAAFVVGRYTASKVVGNVATDSAIVEAVRIAEETLPEAG
ncbi:MAG: DUF6457 domain-containing protein [Actinomycetota bacterium]